MSTDAKRAKNLRDGLEVVARQIELGRWTREELVRYIRALVAANGRPE